MNLRIAIAQLNLLVGGVERNVEAILAACAQARDDQQADVVVFPELTITGYPPEDLLLRSDFIALAAQGLARVAGEVRGVDVVIGFPEAKDGNLFNSACVLRDGQQVAVYRKQYLPNYSVFDEQRYFTAGAQPCVVDIGGVPVGITLCEDIWYPEPVFQAQKMGARLVLNLNASPFHCGKVKEREEIVCTRAREAGVSVVYANLVGGQDELVFDGASFVADREGRVAFRCPEFAEGTYLVELEGDAHLAVTGAGCGSPLEEVERVYQALVLGIRDYVGKNGFRGAVLGLSGGIDSALTLTLAVDALGRDAVKAVMMPSRFTSKMSLEDAAAEATALGVHYQSISIEPSFQAVMDSLKDVFAGLPADTTEENIQARCRGIILMALSNKEGRILLTTGNKSEMAVGYSTLYGDMAGGFAPLKDVPKGLVYRLARYRNRDSEVIPGRVLERPPSAELAPGQVDQDSLPAYEVLDPILERYVERDMGIREIVADGFSEDTVRQVVRMVDRNEYKRRQAPPGVRITPRAFGRDRRYPVTSGFGRSPA